VRVAQLIGDIDVRSVRVEDVEPYFQHVAHVDFEMFLRMLELAGQHSAEDILAEVQVPTLVVAGEKDSFTPPGISEAMAEAIRGAELDLIPGGTHVAPLEHREHVATRIEQFLQQHDLLG
jgi:pimeloyl-ACP methyl ester carboxylesterase